MNTNTGIILKSTYYIAKISLNILHSETTLTENIFSDTRLTIVVSLALILSITIIVIISLVLTVVIVHKKKSNNYKLK